MNQQINLDIPDELAVLLHGRSQEDIEEFRTWVSRARADGVDRDAIIKTLVGCSWPKPFVLWQLSLSLKGNVEMILIPEGWFLMGDDDMTNDDDRPINARRRVFVDAYRIGKTPVTVSQFKAYCSDIGVDFFAEFFQPKWGWIDDHPMLYVDWQQARDFCIWAGGYLPTEAQSEKAARGTKGLKYPWGNEYDGTRHQWIADGIFGTLKMTSSVAAYPQGASPYGCLDMAGNVWQWCLDWWGDLSSDQEARNPTGPDTGISRVLRGGPCPCSTPHNIRSASRICNEPTVQGTRFVANGFRLAGPA